MLKEILQISKNCLIQNECSSLAGTVAPLQIKIPQKFQALFNTAINKTFNCDDYSKDITACNDAKTDKKWKHLSVMVNNFVTSARKKISAALLNKSERKYRKLLSKQKLKAYRLSNKVNTSKGFHSQQHIPLSNTFDCQNMMTSPIYCDSDDESYNGSGILLLQEAQRAPEYLQLTIDSDVDEPDQQPAVASSSDSDDEVIILGEKRPTYEEITLEEDEDGAVLERIVTVEKFEKQSKNEVDECLYECPNCEKTFRVESLLKFHIKMHNSVEEDTFPTTTSRISDTSSSPPSHRYENNNQNTPVCENDNSFTPSHENDHHSRPPYKNYPESSRSHENDYQPIHVYDSDHLSTTPVYESDYQSATPIYESDHPSTTPIYESDCQPATPICESDRQSTTPTYESDHQPFTPVYEGNHQSTTPIYESDHQPFTHLYNNHPFTPTYESDRQPFTPIYEGNHQSNSHIYESDHQPFTMYNHQPLTPTYESDHQSSPLTYGSNHLSSLPIYEGNHQSSPLMHESDHQSSSINPVCDANNCCLYPNHEGNHKLMKKSKKKQRHSSAKSKSDMQKKKLKRSHKHKVQKEKHKSHKRRKHKRSPEST